MRRPFLLAFVIVALASVQPSLHAPGNTPHSLRSQPNYPTNQPISELALATTYAPVLYFHERERYRPQDIRVMLEQARLRQTISGVEATVLEPITIAELASAPADAYCDLWYGQDDTSGYLNYTAQGSYYDLNGLLDAYPVTAYARVVHADDGRVAIQYWLFYYYNDWYNKHEGDWEMVQVELDALGQPARAVYAQHHGGTARPWDAIGKVGETHPQAYVALGSHATYFAGDTLFPQRADVGNVRIDVYDRTGRVDPVTPNIQMITDTDPAWLAFAGRWGERAFGDFSGPAGPAQKGIQWSDPFRWGNQRSDAATWYHRNVRVEIAEPPGVAALTLSNPFDADIIVEEERQTIVVHDRPDPSLGYDLSLQARQAFSSTLILEWPDVIAGRIVRRQYGLSLSAGASVTTRVCQACDFVLDVDSNGDGTADRRVLP
ncbi:MAG: hypothetical protein ACRD2A_08225, partial [Vicinamibacterales bacterium]